VALAGFNDDGSPEWRPDMSLQRKIAFENARTAPRGPERDACVDEWLEEALFELSVSIQGYRKLLHDKTKPTRMLRKSHKEEAAYWFPRLATVDAVNDWWVGRFRAIAEDLRAAD
jgi:hypothetical protein